MAQEQLHAAHNLIEQGRIAEAKALLQTMDDPTAQLWLAQLQATKRPQKRSRGVPLPLLIALAALVGSIALIAVIMLTPSALASIQNGAAHQQEKAAATQEAHYADLAHFCTMTLGYGGDETCLDWTEAALRDYPQGVESCLGQFGVETPEDRAQVGDCLAKAGVPPPY